ncbi:methyltransferase domain-containing protein [Synechococcus sp. CCAP 1479/9]|uniref:methyltransferase domain-containing protein n=1 Tax=Synechococcus sp. CCAP 1479/9 TaxID=1221593 RepID=UPI001C23D8C0|nr:methyltransferase domain-containing protein [Synechococcus sp. CCAP 1479/9]
MTSGDTPADTYILGTEPEEQERLRLQHELWRPAAIAAWERAGLGPGQRVLDLGAGPGFCALDLARIVGPGGRVLALERSGAYVAAARAAAAQSGFHQLEVQAVDLGGAATTDDRGHRAPGLGTGGFDLAWCRWLAMFLPRLEPLLELVTTSLRPGGVLVAHEYVHWNTFGLHPDGAAIARFRDAAIASFRGAGGNPDVNRRLPSLLAARGFGIEELLPLPVVGRGGDPWARWLERFVTLYGQELIRQGHWSAEESAAAAAAMARARLDPGAYWVGPTVLALRARRGQHP